MARAKKSEAVVETVAAVPPPSFRRVSLGSIVKGIQKSVGASAALQLASPDAYMSKVPYWISTGCPSLDAQLGGGIAGGRLIEIFSHQESEGKTTLAYHIARECQKIGGVVVYIDAEKTADPEYMTKLGVDVTAENNAFAMSNPDTLEEMLKTMESFITSFREKDTTSPLLIILDSVAAAMPESQDKEEDWAKAQIGTQARALSQGLRKLNGIVSKNSATVVFLNQSRMKIGVMYGDPNETPGGKAMKFYTSQRIAIKKTSGGKITANGAQTITDENPLIGFELEAHVVKNKVYRPHGKAKILLYFDKGFDFADSAFNLALSRGLILEDTKGVYTHKTRGGKFRRKDFGKMLEATPEMLEDIRLLVNAAPTTGILPPQETPDVQEEEFREGDPD